LFYFLGIKSERRMQRNKTEVIKKVLEMNDKIEEERKKDMLVFTF